MEWYWHVVLRENLFTVPKTARAMAQLTAVSHHTNSAHFPEVSPITVPKRSEHKKIRLCLDMPCTCNRLTGCVTSETRPVPALLSASQHKTQSPFWTQFVPTLEQRSYCTFQVCFVTKSSLSARIDPMVTCVDYVPRGTRGWGREGGGPTKIGNLVSLATGRF